MVATKDSTRIPVLEYELPGGWSVLAGRTDRENDHLTFRLARPNDWWFHLRGQPGSHVVLRARPDADPDPETLEQAAAIAAYHSKARAGGLTSVSCTQVRFVGKPPGAPPGTVTIRRETTLRVRPALPPATSPRPSGRGTGALPQTPPEDR